MTAIQADHIETLARPAFLSPATRATAGHQQRRRRARIAARAAALALVLSVMPAVIGCSENGSSSLNGYSALTDTTYDYSTDMPSYRLGGYRLAEGDAAPDFTVEVVDKQGFTGETISLSDLQGKVILLDFWAPWCPYCLEDLPSWDKLAQEYGDNLVVIAVDCGGDTFGEMCDFIAEHDYQFTYAISNKDIGTAYSCPAVPYDLIIDKDGTIAFIAEGSYRDMSYSIMKSVLDQLI